MNKTIKKLLVETAVLAAVFLTDIASKYLVFHLFDNGSVSVIDGLFSIECVDMYGPFFRLF